MHSSGTTFALDGIHLAVLTDRRFYLLTIGLTFPLVTIMLLCGWLLLGTSLFLLLGSWCILRKCLLNGRLNLAPSLLVTILSMVMLLGMVGVNRAVDFTVEGVADNSRKLKQQTKDVITKVVNNSETALPAIRCRASKRLKHQPMFTSSLDVLV